MSLLYRGPWVFTYFLPLLYLHLLSAQHRKHSAVSDAWGKHGIKNALVSPTHIMVDNCVSPEQPSFWEEFSHSLKRQLHRTSRLPRYYFTIFFNCYMKV